MITDGKTGTLSLAPRYGNQSGSIFGNTNLHAQRIDAETVKEYNASTSHRHLEQVKRYAGLIRNYKNIGIKSLMDNIRPFKGAGSSSVEFGSLAAANDIAEDDYVRGTISDYVEVWGSLIFNHRDLMEHNGRIPESTFLDVLPDVIEDFMGYMKQVVSVQLGTGPHFAECTADSDLANGIVEVNRIDRFNIGQKCNIDDDNSAPAVTYITAIDVNLSRVTVSATRGGAALDISAYTIAQNSRFYHPGITAAAGSFVSLKSALLSAANGGSTNLHGVAKTLWPFLQAVNVSGAAITESNLLDELFDAYTDVRTKAKGNANEILMSYKNLGTVMKLIEVQKGGFKVTPGSMKASEYGWTEIEITSVKGTLKVVGIQEMDDDVIFFIDWKALAFRSNGFFKKRKSPDGIEYFEVRNTTGNLIAA